MHSPCPPWTMCSEAPFLCSGITSLLNFRTFIVMNSTMRQKKPKQEPKKKKTWQVTITNPIYILTITVNILLSSFLGKMLGLSLTSLALNLTWSHTQWPWLLLMFKNANTIVLTCAVQYEHFFLTKNQLKAFLQIFIQLFTEVCFWVLPMTISILGLDVLMKTILSKMKVEPVRWWEGAQRSGREGGWPKCS